MEVKMENEQENRAEPTAEEPDTGALQKEIEAGKAVIAEMKNNLVQKESEIAALNKSLTAAVGAYRGVVVQGNPGVLAELINGDSVETINTSLQSARAVMARARQEVEAEAARVRVPAGAPQRAPQDFSSLTAREKIRIGIKG
jgi:hypothetical protein